MEGVGQCRIMTVQESAGWLDETPESRDWLILSSMMSAADGV